jgi:hypothetical protein
MTDLEFANKYLTPPERARYINNIKKCSGGISNYNHNEADLCSYIYHAFCLFFSKEGERYWYGIINKLRERL